jgi:hypothetical protein
MLAVLAMQRILGYMADIMGRQVRVGCVDAAACVDVDACVLYYRCCCFTFSV